MALMVLGYVGHGYLGVDLFPDVNFPIVVINTPYPGASPKEVETQVTKPIEDTVASINGVDKLRSYSREGFSAVPFTDRFYVSENVLPCLLYADPTRRPSS